MNYADFAINAVFGKTNYEFNQFDTKIALLSNHYKFGFLGVSDELNISKITPTRYPVESYQQIATDHIHIEPKEIELTLLVSGSSDFTPFQAFQALKTLQEKRETTSIISNLSIYKNMILEEISGTITPNDDKAIIKIKAKEIRVLGRDGFNIFFANSVTSLSPALGYLAKSLIRGRVRHKEIKAIITAEGIKKANEYYKY